MLLLTLGLLAGCTTPIGARRTTAAMAQKQVVQSALEGKISDTSIRVLHRHGLSRQYEAQPERALAALDEIACNDGRRDVWFALGELSYLEADRRLHSVKPGVCHTAPDSYLASAIFCWFYLLARADDPPPGPFERNYRIACDLYNRAVARAFLSGPRTNSVVLPAAATRTCGSRIVQVLFDASGFQEKLSDVESFLPVDEFVVRGLSVRDRHAGLGAPLIAKFRRELPPSASPVGTSTLLLRVPTDPASCRGRELPVSLELYSGYATNQVIVDGVPVPLEKDLTAPLAYALNDARVWRLGTQQFFSPVERLPTRIYETQPFSPGRIPVVFVHGTASSPVWWAEMWNTLHADPRLADRFQFWNFLYNSGNPILVSARRLREELSQTLRHYDPDGADPALKRVVVIGHSQGGLLAKLTATETGSALWDSVFPVPVDQAKFNTEAERDLFRETLVFRPLPEVKRVVFIATPHRGSFLASQFIRQVVRRLIALPKAAVHATEAALRMRGVDPTAAQVRKVVPTSLDGMAPDNPTLLALAKLPLAPGVKSHSIIAVKGKGPPESGDDGVVKYTSAKLDGVESEFIVRGKHSCQDRPEVIEEVRRILLEHLKSCETVSEAKSR